MSQIPEDVMQTVASIVPDHCSGSALAFDPGVLHVNKDGSGYIAINEDDFVLEDDRCEGPDGPEGSVHWIVRLDASEVVALRDFLNGNTTADRLADKIEDLIAEFGDDPKTALQCVSEHLGLRRHAIRARAILSDRSSRSAITGEETPAPSSHLSGSEADELAEINTALKTINDTCAALQYDDRGRYGAETIQPLRDVAKLINKLVFKAASAAPAHSRMSVLEEAAKVADDAAINAAAMKDRKAATSIGGTAVLTGYIFAETEAKAIAAKIRALTTEGNPSPQPREVGSHE